MMEALGSCFGGSIFIASIPGLRGGIILIFRRRLKYAA